MSVALENVLAEAGLRVKTSEFLTYVADAARRLSPPHPVPADYLSAQQRAALTDVGLDLSPHTDDEPDARSRTVAELAVLADTALTVGEAARALDVDDSRIRHKLKERRLIGWKDQSAWRLPHWQFTGTGLLPGLEVVLRAVPDDQPPLVVAGFMNTPQPDLVINGRQVTPREWLLAAGDPSPVAELASVLGTPA